jgi:hypothetical protein
MDVIVSDSSVLFRTAVELYLRHTLDGVGRCEACGRFGCSTGDHAAGVIRAAGVNPAFFDSRPRSRTASVWWAEVPTAVFPSVQHDTYDPT